MLDPKGFEIRFGSVYQNIHSVKFKRMERGFKFVGPVIVYAWMQAAGMVDDHSPHCYKRKARLCEAPLAC
jgi:DNA-3-methyladenine glycosylase I